MEKNEQCSSTETINVTEQTPAENIVETDSKANTPEKSCDLNEIRDLLIEQNRIGKRKSAFLLIAAIAIAAFCAFGIVIVLMLLPKVNTTVDNINTAVANIDGVIAELDMQEINTLIEDTSSIAKEGVTIVEQAKALLEDLNNIDFDALNSSIQGLDATLESISVINFDTLNQAITDLQTAIEPFANFVGLFKN